MNIIEIKNLTKNYGKARGITSLSFEVKEGEIFGFIGPNGAGKSTLIRTLLNLIFPTTGTATIFGLDIVKESTKIKQDVGYLPAEVNYYSKMTVSEFLNFSALFYHKDCKDRISYLAKKLDLDLKRKIEDLSMGNLKKVGIVQALLHEPKLLVFDEPTSGLDPLIQQKFFEILLEEKEKGVTIFFSSHVLSDVQKICDRVAIIKEGELIKIEEIKNLRINKVKYVHLEFADDIPKLDLKGIKQQETIANIARFMYQGDLKELLSFINNQKIVDIKIEEPSLEEIFMHYYG